MGARTWSRAGTLTLAMVVLTLGAQVGSAKTRSTYAPHIDKAEFQATVDHPYFPLVPGTRYSYRETAGKKISDCETTVMSETKLIMGVTCSVVHDVLKSGGEVIEDTYDWYAQDKAGNVWYFGEDTKEYGSHGRVDTEGSWQAGVGGALPGILMPASIVKGQPYRQEYLRGHAEDMGQIVGIGEAVKVHAGAYTDCVRTKDWSMLEAGHEFKWYARGVGMVRSESASKEVSELLSVVHP